MPVTNVNDNQPVLSGDELKKALRAVSKELDKEAFLKLLIAQLANQDPMNPMEDREFIAQMAQFSSLEQMANMSKTMERMAEANKFSAVSYVGKTVGFTKEAETPGEKPKQVVAAVKAVWFDDPKQGPVLETTEGFVPLSKIEGVGPEYKVKAKS